MNPTSEEIKACAEKLHQAQKENYPWCFIEDDIVEQYVKQNGIGKTVLQRTVCMIMLYPRAFVKLKNDIL